MPNDLKPCPFCGHTGLIFNEGSTYRWGEARCAGCEASAGEVRRSYPDNGEWHTAAIEQWNTRVTHEGYVVVPRDLLERLAEWDQFPHKIKEALTELRAILAQQGQEVGNG